MHFPELASVYNAIAFKDCLTIWLGLESPDAL